jgi:pyruvate dehydrogenase E2 component (dihydrolipoamide acetyltransferase)
MAEVVSMPKLGFDMAEGILVRWVVHEGGNIAKGAILAEIETDKATVEVESTYGGVVARHLVSEGDVVPVNQPIAVIADPGEEVNYEALLGGASKAETRKAPAAASEEASPVTIEMPTETVVVPAADDTYLPGSVKASPLAKRMAEERGIDLRKVKGSGPDGRIVKKDIESYTPPVAPVAIPTPALAPSAPPVYLPGAPAPESQSVPLNRLRAAIGRRMTEAKQQVPHFYVTHEYDMEPVMALRQQVNSLLPENEKTSVNDYLVKAAALCLQEFPNLNASLDGSNIVRHGQINVGVAVAVEGGLLTVVCRDANLKPVRLISSEVRTMVARAREGKVRPDDIEGSTFSVSNLGMFDVEHFIAIINPPEAAILAIGSVRQVPVVKDNQVLPGMTMKATISVDHRVSDGAEAARFMQSLDKYLQEPLRLMI